MSEVAIEKNLPLGWVSSKLSELSSLKGGFAFKSKEYTETGIPILRMGNITKDFRINWNKRKQPFYPIERKEEFKEYLLTGGELIICLTDMSETGNYLGTVALNTREALLNQRVSKFLFDEERIMKKFLYFALCNPKCRHYMISDDTGSLQKNTSHKHVLAYELDYPESITQQKRIVAKIEELFSHIDAGIAALNKAKKLLKQYRQSVLKAAVTGELTKEWREQNKDKLEPASQLLERILKERRQKWEEQQLEQFKAKGKVLKDDKWKGKYNEPVALEVIPSETLPVTWVWVALGQVFEVFVGATPSRKKLEYWGEDINWVSSGEVAFCRIKDTKEKISEEGLNNTSTALHPPGTVMLGMIGEGKTRGQAAILDIYAAHNQNTSAIEKCVEELSTEFLYFYLMQQYELTRKRGSGNNQKALNKTRVQAIEFPLAPVEEQLQISEILEEKFISIERLENEIYTQLVMAEKNKQSILASAFSGAIK